MRLALSIAVAGAGGLLGSKMGMQQGALLGSLLVVAAVNATGLLDVPRLPGPLLFMTYILISVELASRVNPATVSTLARAWLPAVIFVGVMIAAGVLAALALQKLFGFDLATALFGTAPGAVSAIAAMGSAAGANVAVVVAMHTIRVTVIMIALPILYRLLSR